MPSDWITVSAGATNLEGYWVSSDYWSKEALANHQRLQPFWKGNTFWQLLYTKIKRIILRNTEKYLLKKKKKGLNSMTVSAFSYMLTFFTFTVKINWCRKLDIPSRWRQISHTEQRNLLVTSITSVTFSSAVFLESPEPSHVQEKH